jgi:hypothetical protein
MAFVTGVDNNFSREFSGLRRILAKSGESVEQSRDDRALVAESTALAVDKSRENSKSRRLSPGGRRPTKRLQHWRMQAVGMMRIWKNLPV